MLFTLTSVIDFVSMTASLWLALYLLGRGYTSRITLRGVVVLVSLSAFFLGAYINLYKQIPGATAVRAVFLTIGLSVWNDLTHRLLPVRVGKIQRSCVRIIYAFGLITIVLMLWTRTAYGFVIGLHNRYLFAASLFASCIDPRDSPGHYYTLNL